MYEDINYIQFNFKSGSLPIVSSYKDGDYSITNEQFDEMVILNSIWLESRDGTKSYLVNLSNVSSMFDGYIFFQQGTALAGVELDESIALSYDARGNSIIERERLSCSWQDDYSDFGNRTALSF